MTGKVWGESGIIKGGHVLFLFRVMIKKKLLSTISPEIRTPYKLCVIGPFNEENSTSDAQKSVWDT